jgi:hypothetical protein
MKKQWRSACLFAFCDGLVNGVILWSLAPATPWRAGVAILAYNSGRSLQSFMKENPIIIPKKIVRDAVLLFMLGLTLSGCAQYTVQKDGSTRLTLFMQKAAFEGLKVSPKTGLSVKVAETQGDAELAHAIASGAAEGAAKGAKKTLIPFLP